MIRLMLQNHDRLTDPCVDMLSAPPPPSVALLCFSCIEMQLCCVILTRMSLSL